MVGSIFNCFNILTFSPFKLSISACLLSSPVDLIYFVNPCVTRTAQPGPPLFSPSPFDQLPQRGPGPAECYSMCSVRLPLLSWMILAVSATNLSSGGSPSAAHPFWMRPAVICHSILVTIVLSKLLFLFLNVRQEEELKIWCVATE